MKLRFLALFVGIFTLGACAQIAPPKNVEPAPAGLPVVREFLATDAPLAPYQLGSAYEVDGVRYVPKEDFNYKAIGRASYYSSALNGALTASGEKYSSGFMTAAHKTLPFQTIVRVTHMRSGLSTIVRINDRGPFKKDHIIDLSERAATDIGILNEGSARVQVEVLEAETKAFAAALQNGRVIPGEEPKKEEPAPSTGGSTGGSSGPSTEPGEGAIVTPERETPPADSQNQVAGGFYVLCGTYTSRADANAIRDRMAKLGNAFVEESNGVFKVYIGPMSTRLEAQAMLGRVFAEGATNASVVQR